MAQVYKVNDSNEATAAQQFECAARAMAINNDSLYRTADNRLEVLNMQGGCSGRGGRPMGRSAVPVPEPRASRFPQDHRSTLYRMPVGLRLRALCVLLACHAACACRRGEADAAV